MVRVWYMADPVVDQFAENQLNPPQPLSLAELAEKTGVIHQKVEVDENNQDALLDAVPTAAKCSFRDVIDVSPDKMKDQFESKLKTFFHEHLHTDDEVRFVLDGTGYFDVRSREDDRWIRIAVERGDLIDLPAGMYHRFTTDASKHLKAMRLFVGEPVWTPYNRDDSTDKLAARKDYLNHAVVPREGDLITF